MMIYFGMSAPNPVKNKEMGYDVSSELYAILRNRNVIKNLLSNLQYKAHLIMQKMVDHSDVFGASPLGAAPNASSFST